MMRFLFGLLMVCMAASVLADSAEDAPHQPRQLGNTAVLHVYYYAPASLEITYVDTYLFKDVDACKDAISRALMIALPTASAGDRVAAKCVGLHPPKDPKAKADSDETVL